MKQSDRNLWIAAALSIAAAVLAVSGMTIVAIAAGFAPPAAQGGSPVRDLTVEFLLGALMCVLTLFSLAQIVARRYLLFANYYCRPVPSWAPGLMSVVTLALTVMVAMFISNTLERIGRHAGSSVVDRVFFPGLGMNFVMLAILWMNLANMFFVYWRQSLGSVREARTDAAAPRIV